MRDGVDGEGGRELSEGRWERDGRDVRRTRPSRFPSGGSQTQRGNYRASPHAPLPRLLLLIDETTHARIKIKQVLLCTMNPTIV